MDWRKDRLSQSETAYRCGRQLADVTTRATVCHSAKPLREARELTIITPMARAERVN
jgi:hypothetical protein